MTQPVLRLHAMRGSDTGSYTCRIKNALGEVETHPATVKVVGEGPQFVKEPVSVTVMVRKSVTLTCEGQWALRVSSGRVAVVSVIDVGCDALSCVVLCR
jgi:hypothetical protein